MRLSWLLWRLLRASLPLVLMWRRRWTQTQRLRLASSWVSLWLWSWSSALVMTLVQRPRP